MLHIPTLNYRFRLSAMARPLFFAAALFYLGYHTMHGERGLYALFVEQRRLSYLEQKISYAHMEEQRMQKRVSQLSNGVLDKDLLDEQARSMLGLIQPNEVMVILD